MIFVEISVHRIAQNCSNKTQNGNRKTKEIWFGTTVIDVKLTYAKEHSSEACNALSNIIWFEIMRLRAALRRCAGTAASAVSTEQATI